MGKNIVLVGFMGTGKSSVGNRLAQKLNKRFIDMDKEIELLLGMTIPRIFKVYGEKRFRSEEKLLVAKLCKQEDCVISTGGGIILEEENLAALREDGVLVRLNAKPEDLWERISRKKENRPLLKKHSSINDMIALMQEREKYYSQAHLTIDTSSKELDQVVDEIISLL